MGAGACVATRSRIASVRRGGGGGFVVEGAVGPPLTLVRPLLVQRVNSGEISVYSIVELTSFTVNTIQNRRFVLVGPPQPTRPP